MKIQSYSVSSWLWPWGQGNHGRLPDKGKLAFGLKELVRIKNVNMVRKMLSIENCRNMINMHSHLIDFRIKGEMDERGQVNIFLTVSA